jgi:hypothetical protein
MGDVCAEKFPPKPPRCFACAGPMRLVRRTPRFGGLPDLYAFQCQACGELHIEEGAAVADRTDLEFAALASVGLVLHPPTDDRRFDALVVAPSGFTTVEVCAAFAERRNPLGEGTVPLGRLISAIQGQPAEELSAIQAKRQCQLFWHYSRKIQCHSRKVLPSLFGIGRVVRSARPLKRARHSGSRHESHLWLAHDFEGPWRGRMAW